MTRVEDYITKQVYIDKNVVTFRSLSRQFKLHVNEAKNELAKFHNNAANADTRSFATYLVSGELLPTRRIKPRVSTQTEDGMDVDSEAAVVDVDSDSDEEDVPVTTMTLVGENELEHTKSKYARIFSIHVYCLSPSPLTDVDLICGPSNIVYSADAKDAPTSSIALGRVVGPDVYVGKVSKAPVASTSKAPELVSRKPTLKPKTEAPAAKSTEKEKEQEKPAPLKPKASGKLDWSKAKTAGSDKSREKETKVKKESVSPAPPVKSNKTPPKADRDTSPQDESKRGTKRKAAPPPPSDTEDTAAPKEDKRATNVTTKSDIKVRKNRVLSDDEDSEDEPKPRRNAKLRSSIIQSVLESEEQASLRAMMDMDDSQVEKASSSRPPPKAEPKVPEDEDVVMASEPEPEPEPEPAQDEDMMEDTPKPKARKKKERKVWPVGRNGLKKKRVMKSRMTTDAKGYMVTEDYSSYESVDEEEAEQATQNKPKGKKAAPAKPKKEEKDEDAVPPPKSKPAAASRTGSIKAKSAGVKAGGQGNLKDFFGKPKK